jgi:hypothetical protein
MTTAKAHNSGGSERDTKYGTQCQLYSSGNANAVIEFELKTQLSIDHNVMPLVVFFKIQIP